MTFPHLSFADTVDREQRQSGKQRTFHKNCSECKVTVRQLHVGNLCKSKHKHENNDDDTNVEIVDNNVDNDAHDDSILIFFAPVLNTYNQDNLR